jgi:hypothetical protein
MSYDWWHGFVSARYINHLAHERCVKHPKKLIARCERSQGDFFNVQENFFTSPRAFFAVMNKSSFYS